MKTDVFLKTKKKKRSCKKCISCFILAITAASDGLGVTTSNPSYSTHLSLPNFNAIPRLVIQEVANNLNFNDTNAFRFSSRYLAEVLTPLQTDRLIARYQKILPGLGNYKQHQNTGTDRHYYRNNNVDFRTITPPYAHLLDTDDSENSVQENSEAVELSCFKTNFSIIER